MSHTVLKVYLSGAATAFSRKASPISVANDESSRLANPVKLGLVNVTNSTTNRYNRVRRGIRGITTLGRVTIRESLHLMGKRHRTHNLGFLTCTIPSLPKREMRRLALHWPDVAKNFTRALKRELVANGSSDELCYVTEIQPKRLRRYGEVAPHLHIVFVARVKTTKWAIDRKRFDELWSNALSAAMGYRIPTPTACTVKPLTSNAKGELAKYMSKGRAMCQEVIEMGLGDYLPSSWWGATDTLRAAIKAGTVVISDYAPLYFA